MQERGGSRCVSSIGVVTARAPVSKFRRLSVTHAAMVGGDAAMIVALADSLFFSIDPSAARGRVLLFLIVSFAPFVVIAPLIGPVIDRAAGGRRTVIQLVAAARIVISLLMAAAIDNLALFPLVFAALVLQKTYLVSKQALVPSVVRDERDLVEANSKLGLIAGLAGFVAIIPAAIMQLISNEGVATLIYAALLFGFALASATRLPADVVAAEPEGSAERVQLQSTRAAAGRGGDAAAAGDGRVHLLPPRLLVARPDRGHGLVRRRRRARRRSARCSAT